MRTVTLSQLRTDVVNQADLVAVGADTFITTTELNRWIIQSSRGFFGRFFRGASERRFEDEHSFSTVDGTTQYSLPADFFELYQAQATRDGYTVPIYPAGADELARGDNDGLDGTQPRYRVVGNTIELTPTPDTVYTVELRYCPNTVAFDSGGSAQADLSADTDYLDGVNGWEQWIVWDVCVKATLKQEQDPSGFQALKQELEAQINREKRRRDRGPKVVRQVFREQMYGSRRGPWGDWP